MPIVSSQNYQKWSAVPGKFDRLPVDSTGLEVSMPQTDVFSMPYMFGYVHGYCKAVSEARNPPHRYPISLQLRYTAKSEHGTLHRFGQTRMMSSKEIIFAPGDGLAPGMEAEIAVAWPFLLEGRIHLQLVLDTTITASQNGVAQARIVAYHFRIRRTGGIVAKS